MTLTRLRSTTVKYITAPRVATGRYCSRFSSIPCRISPAATSLSRTCTAFFLVSARAPWGRGAIITATRIVTDWSRARFLFLSALFWEGTHGFMAAWKATDCKYADFFFFFRIVLAFYRRISLLSVTRCCVDFIPDESNNAGG